VFPNAVGCDSTHTLNLTIVYSNTGSTSPVACDSYNWVENGNTTYTISGNYSATYTNVDGCDSVHTIHLTINYSNSGASPVTSCDSYTWTTGDGNTYTASANPTHVYTNAAGCDSTHTLNITINYSNSGSSPVTSCESYTWEGNTYTLSANPTHVYQNAAGCDSTHTLNITINYSSTYTLHIPSAVVSYVWPVTGQTYTTAGPHMGTIANGNSVGCDSIITMYIDTIYGVRVAAKVLLDGPYNATTGLMNDDLRAAGLLPTTEPYTLNGKPVIGEASGETTTAGVLAVTGNDAIVDWVYMEVRTGAPSYSVVATKRALVQRDGDIVDVDGVSQVVFSSLLPGNYWVAVKHRNHLGAMTANAQNLVLIGTSVDFTNAVSTPQYVKVSSPALVNAPTKAYGSVRTLWSGDAMNDKNTKYNGGAFLPFPNNAYRSNDKEFVLLSLGGNANGLLNGVYRSEDANMDGVIKYNNTNNDRAVILGTVGVGTPNAIYNQHTPN